MKEIAKIYGVKLGENFTLKNASGYTIGIFKFNADGLFQYAPCGANYEFKLYYNWSDIIIKILNGTYGLRKMTNEDILKTILTKE